MGWLDYRVAKPFDLVQELNKLDVPYMVRSNQYKKNNRVIHRLMGKESATNTPYRPETCPYFVSFTLGDDPEVYNEFVDIIIYKRMSSAEVLLKLTNAVLEEYNLKTYLSEVNFTAITKLI